MQFEMVTITELSPEMKACWRSIQAKNSFYASPYFCIEFMTAVNKVHTTVFVTVIKEEDNIVGFFPFQKNRWNQGHAVGGALSDFHGVIAEKPLLLSEQELLKASGLVRWKFTHLATDQIVFKQSYASESESHFIDLSNGFEGYKEELGKSGSKMIKDTEYKLRKLNRLHGEVKFISNVEDPAALDLLLEWKSRQYKKSGLIDVFGFEWTKNLLKELRTVQTENFAGMLSALYVNETPVALHFGMRSKTVWNWWFPRHDTKYNNCSPGVVLRLEVAKYAHNLGVSRIDLGIGGADTYKPRLANNNFKLAQGIVEIPSMMNTIDKMYQGLETTIRKSPLKKVLWLPGRIIKNIEKKNRFS
jgi:CelD/BcsL family acetyltransferase involved in cellulose biosynthesis